MRKFLWLGAIVLALFAACSKEKTLDYNPVMQYTQDSTAIVNYLSQNSLTATYDSITGIFYNTSVPGSGDSVKLSDNPTVTVLYKGQLLNGLVFDSTGTIPFKSKLNQVIAGWGAGFSHVRKGGSIRLYIPSILGYGPYANPPIPANSPLIFDIQVQDVTIP